MTNTVAPLARPAVDTRTARRNLARLRDALVRADNLLADYWRTDEWRALGHATWREFVAKELPQLRVLLVGDPATRDAKLVELVLTYGMSMGAAADTLGVGKATAHRALAGVELPEKAKASDGRTMATRQAPATPRRKKKRAVPLTDQIVALLIDRGPLDVLEITAALRGCDRSVVSPALTRLDDSGRIAYLAPARRGLFGRYTVADQ